MSVIDASIANVALPTIARDLRIDGAMSIWIVNAYQIAVTALLLPSASLGDILGYRRVYTIGLAVFTAASLGAALAGNFALLLIARVVQGVGAAALMSIAPALNRSIFPARMLGVAVGVSAFTVATSAAAGPAIGGALLAVRPWPWIFAINVPLGTIAALFAYRALPSRPGTGAAFDSRSALFAGLALTLTILAVGGSAHHLSPPSIAGLLASGGLLLAAFIRRQRILEHPMLPLDIFALPRFSLAIATSLASFCAAGLTLVALPFLLQNDLGFTPLVAGSLFAAWPITIAIIAPLAGRLSDRVPAPPISTAGLAVFAAGISSLALLPTAPGPAQIGWRMALCGLGFGLFQAPNNREILGSLPRDRSGSAGGVLASARLLGQSLGAAIVTAALAHGVTARHAFWFAVAVAAIAATVSATRLRRRGGFASV